MSDIDNSDSMSDLTTVSDSLSEICVSVSNKYRTIPYSRSPIDAMHGKTVDLYIGYPENRAAIIYGIRNHHQYAIGPDITALCTGDNVNTNPDFARARNARLIMSNVIPSIQELGLCCCGTGNSQSVSKLLPYCIWFPDFALESTYRTLARQYPVLKYQVARACAAAGFDQLYFELDVLPDISIAEEARESQTKGGKLIYNMIMAAPIRYAVMNDYLLSVNLSSPQYPAYLNGNTAVRWMMNIYPVESVWLYPGPERSVKDPLPRVTEDGGITPCHDADTGDFMTLNDEERKLLYSPLPQDLPTVKKTLLIQMAAFNGDIDRYVRLVRRLMPLGWTEHMSIINGIYHHPLFARFWVDQMNDNTQLWRRMTENQQTETRKAISARRIMSNDTQEIEDGWRADKPCPFQIWWPEKPHWRTLHKLFDRVPTMREAVVVAAIMGDDLENYLALEFPPTEAIYLAARESSNPIYLERVLKDAKEQGIEIDPEVYARGNNILSYIVDPPDRPDPYCTSYSDLDRISLERYYSISGKTTLEAGLTYRWIWMSLNKQGMDKSNDEASEVIL